MAVTKGKDGEISAEGSFIGELRSFSLTETSNEVDTSTMGTDWTGVDSTQNSWSGSLDMFWDPIDVGQAEVTVGSKIDVVFYPAGNSTGKQSKTGSALVTSIESSQGHDNLVTATVSFTGDGVLTTGVVS